MARGRSLVLSASLSVGLVVVPAGAAQAAPCDRAAAAAKAAEAEKASDPAVMARLAREAIALCATDAHAHNALGTALQIQKRAGDAEAEYRRAAELDPGWSVPHLGLGDLARDKGDVAAARSHYSEALGLARTPDEKDEAAKALESVERAGYAFKSSRSIAEALSVGQALPRSSSRGVSIRKKDPSLNVYEDSAGPAINFSIRFEVSSAAILEEGQAQLAELARALEKSEPSERYVVEGHASSEGDARRNLALSVGRAQAVVDLLVKRFGIRSTQLEAVGRGSEQPVTRDGLEDRDKSRRVVVIRRYDTSG